MDKENQKTVDTLRDMNDGFDNLLQDVEKDILDKNNQFVRQELNRTSGIQDKAVGLDASDIEAYAKSEHYDNILGIPTSERTLDNETVSKLYKKSSELIDAILVDYLDKTLGFK